MHLNSQAYSSILFFYCVNSCLHCFLLRVLTTTFWQVSRLCVGAEIQLCRTVGFLIYNVDKSLICGDLLVCVSTFQKFYSTILHTLSFIFKCFSYILCSLHKHTDKISHCSVTSPSTKHSRAVKKQKTKKHPGINLIKCSPRPLSCNL